MKDGQIIRVYYNEKIKGIQFEWIWMTFYNNWYFFFVLTVTEWLQFQTKILQNNLNINETGCEREVIKNCQVRRLQWRLLCFRTSRSRWGRSGLRRQCHRCRSRSDPVMWSGEDPWDEPCRISRPWRPRIWNETDLLNILGVSGIWPSLMFADEDIENFWASSKSHVATTFLCMHFCSNYIGWSNQGEYCEIEMHFAKQGPPVLSLWWSSAHWNG